MCKNIKFTIINKDNQLVTINCNYKQDDNHLYRCGMPIKCDCDLENPAPFLLLDGEVYCPLCGKKSVDVEFEDNMNHSVYLYSIGTDFNTMQELFKLSETLPYNVWNTVSDYFVKLKSSDVNLQYNIDYVGWVTSNPSVVEDLLDIPVELRVENQEFWNTPVKDKMESTVSLDRVSSDRDSKELDRLMVEDVVDTLHGVFSVVETPYGEFELNQVLCVVDNPLHPPSEYGRGEYWCVCGESKDIWYVRLNFRDGDILEYNNVLIDGSLKGIGKRIGFDENVVKCLLKLKDVKVV